MTKVAIVLTQGFADWEYGLIGGVGGSFYGLDVGYFAPAAGEVRSQGGLTVAVGQDLDALLEWQPKAMVVVGGTLWETDEAPDIRDVLKVQYDRGAVVAGICGGTLALARAGLLDDVPHTSNEARFLGRNAKGYAGFNLFRMSASAVSGERVITAPGTAPVSFAAAVFQGVGLDQETVSQFKSMMAAEHT